MREAQQPNYAQGKDRLIIPVHHAMIPIIST